MILKQERLVQWLTFFFAELLGTATLVYLGCLGCVDNYPGFEPTHLTITLGFGLAVMVALNIFGCISGAHINPMITLAALIFKSVDLITAAIYVVAQLLGGLLGYSLVRASIENKYLSSPGDFCMNQPGLDDTGRAFLVEFICSFLFVLIVCSIWDPRNKNHHDSFPLRFGLCVTCFALVGGSFGGGSMNPARSFGPALYNWEWENQWIYWVAPLSASLTASVVFRLGFYKAERDVSSSTDNRNNA